MTNLDAKQEAPQPNTFQTPAPATNENPFGDEQDEDLPF